MNDDRHCRFRFPNTTLNSVDSHQYQGNGCPGGTQFVFTGFLRGFLEFWRDSAAFRVGIRLEIICNNFVRLRFKDLGDPCEGVDLGEAGTLRSRDDGFHARNVPRRL